VRSTTGVPLTRADRNVSELGVVPSALAPVTAAAIENDYGAVLRVVEPHRDPRRDPADVVAAARRIETIAKQRYQNRLSRIEARKAFGQPRDAYEALEAMLADFRDTQFVTLLSEKAGQWRAELERSGQLAAR
jgi:hypothetical protein